ncbi:MAG: hypothetical protein WD851_05190 [Pirellulales bacterium]
MPPATAHHGRVGSYASPASPPEVPEPAGRLFTQYLAISAAVLVIGGAAGWSVFTNGALAQEAEAPNLAEAADPTGLHELYFGSHLPEDRAVDRKLERAEELLARERFSEAMPLLDGLLAAEQDVFLEPADAIGGPPLSIKARVRKLLSELPPSGREAYSLLYGAEASREVKAALEKHDHSALARAAARFEYLPAGEEAALILAQLAADSGDFQRAAQLIGQLLEHPSARARWGDYLPLRAAELAARLDQRADSERYLAQSSLRGDPANDLRRVLSALPATAHEHSQDRNPIATAGTPHLWERWQARVVVDRRLETQLGTRRDRRRESITSAPLLPSAIAVGDLVVARSLNNLVAIDWRTGKRMWETRPEADAWLDAGDEYVAAFSDGEYGRGRLHPLLLRLWKDAVFASLSSDGERIYAIRDLDYATAAYSTRWGMLPGFPDGAERKSRVSNRLAAYRIDAEGKIAWEIDGAKTNHSLKGAFFLGTPLALSGSLYVMAEIDSQICLLELDPENGILLWRQPLVSLERGIDQDSGRRLMGASLSYRNGLLVCPTGAGVVIGIDPLRRALKWSFQVPVHKELVERQEDLLQRRAYGSFQLLSDQWLDAKAVLTDTEVVVTLPESPDLHCLRLATGETLWTRPREDGLYLAGLTPSQAVIVGKREVLSVALADGELKWRSTHPDELSPSGRGLICGSALCLPLEKGHLAVMELSDGTHSQLLTTHTGQAVGNLVAHRGSVVSQSLAHVDRFDSRQELQLEVEQRLTADVADATALRLAGELAETAGQPAEALNLFRRAHAADTADPLIRERVVDALLTAVKQDFSAHRADVALLESLAEAPLLRLNVLQIKAEGLLLAGELKESFECFLEIYDAATEHDELLVETAAGAARIDRWFRGGLARLWQAGDEDLHAMISNDVAARQPAQPKSPTDPDRNALERFVLYFGGLPGQEPAQLALAEIYSSAGRRREAELAWLQLVVSADPQFSSKAKLRLMRSTVPKSLETLPAAGPMAERQPTTRAPEPWPAVRIAAETSRKRRSRGSRGGRSDEEIASYAPIRFQTALMDHLGPVNFALAANGTEIVAWDVDGDAIVRGNIANGPEQRQANSWGQSLRSGRMGHFVFLSHDDQTSAMDTFAENTEETLLMWSRSGTASRSQFAVNRGRVRQEFAPSEATLLIATPNGLVLHSSEAIYCVHPITGELQWFRRTSQTDPLAFADAQRLFLLSDDRSQGRILAIADGSEIDSWQPPPGSWIASAGRWIVTEQNTPDGLLLRVVDLATGTAEVNLEMPSGTKSVSFGPGWVASLAPSGRLEVIDVGAGKVALSQALEAEPNLVSLEAFRLGEQLYVLTNTRNDADHAVAGYVAPVGQSAATGRLYAFDSNSGSLLWRQPVRLSGRVVLPLQPPALPALLLASFRVPQESGGTEAVVELLAVDKTTGQSLYRSAPLPHAPQDQIVAHLARRPEAAVHIDSQQWEVWLRPTSLPRSPEPVANDEVESIGTGGSDGLWGVGRQLGRILEGAFPNGPNR